MDLVNRNVVVIGGAGFIGSHLVDQLLELGANVTVYDSLIKASNYNIQHQMSRITLIKGDIRDYDFLCKSLEGADLVFNLAALWLIECHNYPDRCVDVNIDGNFNVIRAVHQLEIPCLIHSSSASVYGDALHFPMSEDHPLNNRTMYGASKIAIEQILQAYNEMYNLDYTGLRYMNVYGPRMGCHGAYVSVIPKVLSRIEEELPPIIHGDGLQSYDFVYVEDVARANILAATQSATDEFINVGTGVETTIKDLVEMLLEITGSSLEPVYEPMETTFVTRRVGDTAKAKSLLGFEARTSLKEGLQKFVEWKKAQ